MDDNRIDPSEIWTKATTPVHGGARIDIVTEPPTDDDVDGQPPEPAKSEGPITVEGLQGPPRSTRIVFRRPAALDETGQRPRPPQRPPKPTCRFFSASAGVEGVELAENWPYDQRMKFHACTCPTLNARGQTACDMVDTQPRCAFYEPSPAEVLEAAVIHDEPERVIRLVRNRFGLGKPTYLVVAETTADGAQVVLGTVTQSTHGADAEVAAREAYAAQLEQADLVEKLAKPQPTPIPSYLAQLLEV